MHMHEGGDESYRLDGLSQTHLVCQDNTVVPAKDQHYSTWNIAWTALQFSQSIIGRPQYSDLRPQIGLHCEVVLFLGLLHTDSVGNAGRSFFFGGGHTVKFHGTVRKCKESLIRNPIDKLQTEFCWFLVSLLGIFTVSNPELLHSSVFTFDGLHLLQTAQDFHEILKFITSPYRLQGTTPKVNFKV